MGQVLYEKPIRIELTDNTIFVNGSQHPRDARTLAQMKNTLMEAVDGNRETYYMYRGIHQEENIRFDITVIPAEPLGEECNKTHGHYHERNKGTMRG